MSVDAILKQAEELSLDEQVELAQRLWGRILDSGHEPELTEAQKDELQRRLDRYRDHPDDVVPWEVVKARLDQRVAEADASPDAGIPWEVVKAESLKRART